MDLAKIKALIDLVSRSQVTELELTEGDTTLRLSRSTAPPSQPRADPPRRSPRPRRTRRPRPKRPPSASRDDAVRSPSFGVFHRGPAPDAPPFATVGAAVEAARRCA